MQLSFDIVIATRNRPEALLLSIPLLLDQSRQPQKFIVIDSSDDHTATLDVVTKATKNWPGEVIIKHSRKGLPYQRNLGLSYVTADVVIFPDDDSLFYPGTVEAILATYERDIEGVVAGVCTAEAKTPPVNLEITKDYNMSAEHKWELALNPIKVRLEKSLLYLRPLHFLGSVLRDHQPAPVWLEQSNGVLVEYMTGFRMSFRTHIIKEFGFDEVLKDYALCEDVDASFSAAEMGVLVGTHDGQIYHHRFPGGRGSSYSFGAISVINVVYVALKHANKDTLSSDERAHVIQCLKFFIVWKQLTSLRGVTSNSGRDKIRGIRAAAADSRALLKAAPSDLAKEYRASLDRLKV